MAAPKGNKFWEQRLRHGPRCKFETPEELAEHVQGYFEWLEENPIEFGGVVKPHVATTIGLCLYLGISQQTWITWRNERNDLSEVIRAAEEAIWQNKFSGAAAGFLKENIIAREMGLADKQQSEHSGSVSFDTMSDDELDRRIAEKLQKLSGE